MRKPRIYNATVFVRNLPDEHRSSNGNTQKTVFAACASWKEFAKLVGSTENYCRTYGSQCGGKEISEFCLNNPHKAFYEIGYTKNGYFKEVLPLPPLYSA